MNVAFINPFISSTKSVMGMMASIDLSVKQPQIKRGVQSHGDISGIIAMHGPQVEGSLAITFDKSLSLAIMNNMLNESLQELNEDVRDMVGEMTNMICGGAKNTLSDQGFEFKMATPVIVSGENHSIQHRIEGPKILLTFSSSQGNAYLELCFDK